MQLVNSSTISSFLRCFGMLLQKVNDRSYVRYKIDWMYKQANITIPTNRLGLAKAMGLVCMKLEFVVYFLHLMISCDLLLLAAYRLQHPTWILYWKSWKTFLIMLGRVSFIGFCHSFMKSLFSLLFFYGAHKIHAPWILF